MLTPRAGLRLLPCVIFLHFATAQVLVSDEKSSLLNLESDSETRQLGDGYNHNYNYNPQWARDSYVNAYMESSNSGGLMDHGHGHDTHNEPTMYQYHMQPMSGYAMPSSSYGQPTYGGYDEGKKGKKGKGKIGLLGLLGLKGLKGVKLFKIQKLLAILGPFIPLLIPLLPFILGGLFVGRSLNSFPSFLQSARGKNAVETFMSSDCAERITCEISHAAQLYGFEAPWLTRFIDNSSSKSELMARISRAFKTKVCQEYKCDLGNSLQKILKTN